MHLIVIAWLYVVLMMAIAEATNSNGTVLGAVFTFLLYGLAPVALVMYLMLTPARRRALKEREAAEREAAIRAHSATPDAGGEAPADAVPPRGKKT
jgi:mannose/fructose/N-acetylgalactosamine-specific phosphotransferase system component IID